MPQWVATAISTAEPGTEIGYSHNIDSYLLPDEVMDEELRLVLSSIPSDTGAPRPSEYSLSAPSTAHQTLRILQTSGSICKLSKVSTNLHMIPKRDEKYGSMLRERLIEADVKKQHRTLHNDQDYAQSIMSVKLFQRHGDSPDSTADVSIAARSRKLKSLDELPQTQIRGNSGAAKSFDDVLMSVLVERDIGWPLQQLTKAVKDQGVASVSMAHMKTKLLEICQYQRRGDDTHPKYYLKAEYK